MSECVHRWLLDGPEGGEIDARCKHCDATRVFRPPSFEHWRWENGLSINPSKQYERQQRLRESMAEEETWASR